MGRTLGRQSENANRGFDSNVFINCPFDSEYLPLLRPLLFTIIDLGLVPRIASDLSESGRPRIDRIVSLIRESRFTIHDLSRIRATEAGQLFRLNMPFELGLDVGCRLFQRGCGRKVCLILEGRKYRYQAAISDLAGSDIGVHENQPARIVKVVRDWLGAQANLPAAGPAKIWARFNEFMAHNDDVLKARGYSSEDIRDLSVNDLIKGMRVWVMRTPG